MMNMEEGESHRCVGSRLSKGATSTLHRQDGSRAVPRVLQQIIGI